MKYHLTRADFESVAGDVTLKKTSRWKMRRGGGRFEPEGITNSLMARERRRLVKPWAEPAKVGSPR